MQDGRLLRAVSMLMQRDSELAAAFLRATAANTLFF